MSGTNEALYDKRDENLICYLGNKSNGGMDLYEEYNKGVDKIVDAFEECARKLEAMEARKKKQDIEIQKNREEQKEKIADLNLKISNCRQLIQEKEEEFCSFEEKTLHDCDIQKKNIKDECLRTQNELNEQIENIITQYEFEVQNMEVNFQKEARIAKTQLSNAKAKYQGEIEQLNKEVSDLEHEIIVLAKDEEIQATLKEYEKNPEYKKNALKKYFDEKRHAGQVEKEQDLRRQLLIKIQNRQSMVEESALTRLEQDGFGRELVFCSSSVITNEHEINRLSEMYARNYVLGGIGNKKIDRHKRWKSFGMLFYCYPRFLLGDRENKQLDIKTIVPVSLLILLNYIYFPAIPMVSLLGILIMILYQNLWREQGKMRGLEIFAQAGIFKCFAMLLYPYYLTLWIVCKGIFFWLIVSFCLCCGGDIIYFFKMKSKKNRELFKQIYFATRNNYFEQIQLTDIAMEKYQSYYIVEDDLMQTFIETQQKNLEEIAAFNEKEKEEIEKQFEESGWNEMVQRKEAELLKERENQRKNNAKINNIISEKKENIKEKQSKILLVEKKTKELDIELKVAIEEERQKLEQSVEEEGLALNNKYEEIDIKSEEELRKLEKDTYEKIANKKQLMSSEKEKLQREINNLDQYERKNVEEIYSQKEKQIESRFRNELNDLTTSYRQMMDENLAKLRENGFADLSGFNYIKAWSRLHPLVSNTIGFPAKLDTFCKEILVGLTARATNANYEYCEIMPKHVVWGYESAGMNLPSQIKKEIADTLKEFEEFQGISWRGYDSQYYHISDLPSDDLYKLQYTPFEDGPCLIAYDLGNLEEDIKLRDELKDFILRTFVYNSYQCLSSEKHLSCHIISMNHQADYTSFKNPLDEGMRLKVLENKADIGLALKKLREDKEAVRGKLTGADNLFETNIKLSRDNLTPEDIYEILIVINTNYKELDNSELTYLMELSRDKGVGLYSMLFVDVNEINRMENSDKTRGVECIQKLANAIGMDGGFYRLERGAGTGFCLEKDSRNGFMERIS